MPERSTYAPGTPSWVDIGTDVDAATAFYTGLFGWEAAAGPGEATGGYGMFHLKGKRVAGFGPQGNPGPPFWATYISVADVDATAAAVEAAGGEVVMEPGPVLEAGKMAVFRDPTGAFFSIWEPGDHIGAGLVKEPGTFCWNELNTRDVDAAEAFYSRVFGWVMDRHPMGESGSYTEFELDGTVLGGILDMNGRVPDEVRPHWNVYFAVDDCDATVAAAQALGGEVVVPPVDIETGRFALIRDPQGAHFGVIALKDPKA